MRHRRSLSFVVATAAVLALGACHSGPSGSGKAWNPPSPELVSLSHTDDQTDNFIVRNVDTGRRQAFEDVARMWFADRPSRLTRKPSPY